MKRLNPCIISILLVTNFCFTQCKKENNQFAEIKSQVQGKWKLEYVKGGFIGNYFRDFHNENVIWQLDAGERIMEIYNGAITTDTIITWSKNVGVNTGNNLAYMINFRDKRGYPYVYIVDGIINDSLVLRDNADDGQHYQFSKSQ